MKWESKSIAAGQEVRVRVEMGNDIMGALSGEQGKKGWNAR